MGEKVESSLNEDSKKMQTHDWPLWRLEFSLIFALASLTVLTYIFSLDFSFKKFDIARFTVNTVFWGGCIFIGLFCFYAVQSRMALKKMQRMINDQNKYDILTRLLNRNYFQIRIKEEIARADRDNHPLGILLCDLDSFYRINEMRGQGVGDKVLMLVAKGIQEATRGSDLVFRWGGDEIAVVLSNSGREGCLISAERIRNKVGAISKEINLPLDISIGIAVYPEHGRDPDELTSLADRALFIAKQETGKVHIGEEEYRLDEHSVKIVFQPIVDVQSHKTIGYEALGRDPSGKLQILDLFKKYHSVGKLTELKCICFRSTLKVSTRIGLKKVFINVDFKMLSHLKEVPKPSDIDVILEISELEALDDIDHHLRIVEKWQNQGYKFAIDDFGAGFISLPFIARLLPEYIKLDRSTVLHAIKYTQFKVFLKSMLPALGMNTTEGIIAEGIETEEELESVKDLGIYFIQGFLFGKPKELNGSTHP
jgi:diguanylate cyclase (GGDEF)-like protein